MSIITYAIPSITFTILVSGNDIYPHQEPLPNIQYIKDLISNYKFLIKKYPKEKIMIIIKDYCPECNSIRSKDVTLLEAKEFLKKFKKEHKNKCLN